MHLDLRIGRGHFPQLDESAGEDLGLVPRFAGDERVVEAGIALADFALEATLAPAYAAFADIDCAVEEEACRREGEVCLVETRAAKRLIGHLDVMCHKRTTPSSRGESTSRCSPPWCRTVLSAGRRDLPRNRRAPLCALECAR